MPLPAEVLERLEEDTLLEGEAWANATVPEDEVDFRPLARPHPGHAALLLAAGMVDGIRLEDLLLKGYSYKYILSQEVTKRDAEGYKYTEYLNTERIANVIVGVHLETGELRRYDSRADNAAYEEFLNRNVVELIAEVHRRYTPLFDGDYSRFEPLFARLRAPGRLPGHDSGGLLPEQKANVAALATLYRSGETGAFLQGEMGVGKTFMALAVAALVSTPSAQDVPLNRSKIVVLCPDHLVGKWKREAEAILTEFGARGYVCGNVVDVQRAFAYEGMAVLVLGQQAAKNDSPWKPACNVARRARVVERVRRVEIEEPPYFRDEPYQETRIVEAQICPTCGVELDDETAEGIDEQKSKQTYKHRFFCLTCGGALWSEYPFKKGGRVALARYINKRFPNRFFFINDEAHTTKGATTNIGLASRLLASAARYNLFMTGTLYGGFASSLFHMAHRCLPHFRALYEWNAVNRFIDHFGLRAVVTERKAEYEMSAFGYKRLKGRRSTEIAGASPGMVALLLSHTAFSYLEDIAGWLPPYKEYRLAVAPEEGDPAWQAYEGKIMGELKDAAGSLAARGETALMSAWLQAALGYLDCPEQGERFEADGYSLEIPPITGRAHGKHEAVFDLIRAEVADGRRVQIYFSQVNRRDAMTRMAELLNENGCPCAVLRRGQDDSALPNGETVKVKAEEREAFVERAVRQGAVVLMCSPELVQTGLDLIDFPTNVFFGITYSLYTLRQASRRAWRLGQEHDVKIVFAYWQESLQEVALAKIAQKLRAAHVIDGRAISGLGAMEMEASFLNDLIRKATGAEKPDLPEYVALALPVKGGRDMDTDLIPSHLKKHDGARQVTMQELLEMDRGMMPRITGDSRPNDRRTLYREQLELPGFKEGK
jgi:hypothetical protein